MLPHQNYNPQLTSNEQDDAPGHGNAGLFDLVVSAAVGALHAQAGGAQTRHRHQDTHDHQRTRGLQGTWQTHTQKHS